MDPTIAYYILSGSLLFEGMTLTYAFKTIRKSAGDQDVIEYIKRGADPTTVQVLLEDVAAVTGIMIAFTSITLSHYLALPILDSIGSITIGILLSSVASFLVNRNITALVERRMDQKGEQMIVDVLQNDEVVKSVHDVKSTVLGEWVRFKAEIMFDGERVAQRYLMSLPADIQLQEIERLKKCIEQKEFEAFIVKHGNGIICSLGSEVDRLEWEIKKKVPRVKHCDLEIL